MNEQELRDFRANRQPSCHLEMAEDLTCYGCCAHSSAVDPPPSRPSGERPCCSCVRNPEREEWAERAESYPQAPIVIGDDRQARCFDPFAGALYNGAPTVHFPQDNYVTLDQRDQERFLEKHPEYAKPVWFDEGGHLYVGEPGSTT